MLRKTATQEGKDWNRLIPFLLFAYREVPQESTGFSPFEILYGCEVRDILKESWCKDKRSNENVVSYILLMRERLEKMHQEACTNMHRASTRQKTRYDKGASERSFQPGDKVLVLLPTSSSKLTTQWHGPYPVIGSLFPGPSIHLGYPPRKKIFINSSAIVSASVDLNGMASGYFVP